MTMMMVIQSTLTSRYLPLKQVPHHFLALYIIQDIIFSDGQLSKEAGESASTEKKPWNNIQSQFIDC